MKPLSFHSIYFRQAIELASRSHCQRKQVGCVITSLDFAHVLGSGYNGGAAGQDNVCDSPEVEGNCGCLHAEDNALLKVSAPPSEPKILFCTHLPCPYCAKRIVNKRGFKHVWYLTAYRNRQGEEILHNAGIDVMQYPSSYLDLSAREIPT